MIHDTISDCIFYSLGVFEHYMQRAVARAHDVLGEALELGWRFLEIHLMKIVLGSVILLACYDVRI